ncbi:MAG: DUF1631 family protein [Pseudomonadota bacterium]
MPSRPTLQDFIDDELLRVPMTLDLVIDAVQQRWRERLPAQARSGGIDPARVLQLHRSELTARALAVLRGSAQEDLRATLPGSPGTDPKPADKPRPASSSQALPALSLIDEADVAVDIEIARCTQAVKLHAEIVLRELQTYTSALVNDPNVARDTNPFRPERMVRALWAGVQVLPMVRPLMAAFLADAAQPLANTLQRAYAAACRRLEEQGVVPASYRTIVTSGITTWGHTTGRYQVPDGLRGLRDSMAAPLDALPEQRSGRPAGSPAAAAGGAPDPQLIALLARLFEAIQSDFQMAPETVALMQRLQPTALRVALRDPTLLDRYDHALWRFMDQLAHDLTLSPPSQRMRLLGLGRNLVDHLANAEVHQARGSHGFAWALERLLASQRHALNQAIAAAQPEIDTLERIAADAASASTSGMPLDVGNLDTVPAALLPESTPPGNAQLATTGLPPGAALRAYLQGERRILVSLWQDRRHELALLREPATEQLFAVRQSAIASLQTQGLAFPYKVRSLVRRSADKVLRGL